MNNYYVVYEIDRIQHSVKVSADNKTQVSKIVKSHFGTLAKIISIEEV